MERLLWYVAYDSNLHAARLDRYLRGGRPPGGLRTYPGCRDCRPPRRTVAGAIPGGVYFAGESRAWTGGMAFYDPELPGRAAVRGYLGTVEQFADIAAQEMYRPPGADLDLRDGTTQPVPLPAGADPEYGPQPVLIDDVGTIHGAVHPTEPVSGRYQDVPTVWRCH